MLNKIAFLSILCLSLAVNNAHADITSYDNTFSTGDVFSSDFNTRLNANFTRSLTGGINNTTTTQIVNGTLLEVDMADEINPRIRTYEGAACEFVYSGLLPASGASLTQNITAGTAYPRGYRINKSSATAHTYTASKWTYVDLDINGNFQYSEQTIGGAAPSVASNSLRLARVSTDGSTVLAVQDLRKSSCANGPFSVIADTTGEDSLAELFTLGGSGYKRGFIASRDNSGVITVGPGAAYINGKYRSLMSNLTVPTTLAIPLSGISGLDTGAISASTTYYLYGAADNPATKDAAVVLSSSASAPSGVTYYRRIGELTSDASSGFTTASSDAVSVTGFGKIIQRKKFESGIYATGAVAIPWDNTIPLATEGIDAGISASITPTSTANILKITSTIYLSDASGRRDIACLYQDSSSAIACGAGNTNAGSFPTPVIFTHYMYAGQVTKTTFKLRAGTDTGAAIYINGDSSAAIFGGKMASSIEVEEYEP